MKSGRDDSPEIDRRVLTFFRNPPDPIVGPTSMTQKSTIELLLETELSTSIAHVRAMKVLLVDILLTCAILTAVAAQL